eukprot:3116780-Alexandrium_andersonii.AAC.1
MCEDSKGRGCRAELRRKSQQHRQEHGVVARQDCIRCPVPDTDKVLGALALTGPRRAWQIRTRARGQGIACPRGLAWHAR